MSQSQPQQIGKYEIVRRLGGGGMAEVFAARRIGVEGFTRPVALKRVLPGFSQDSAFEAMFIREAQISAKFNHPNVVSVVDFDRDPEHGLFLAMEMVEGRDLSDLMKTGSLPIPIVIYVTTEILRGLGYAHNLPPDESGIRGVVHRDVSPHNVLVSWEGAVKVSDFGIAKTRGAATSASASMMIKGKPAYMSPEQANSAKLDGRSDLFAVGVMLWEMLVCRPLFAGGTMQEMFAALFFGPIPSPHAERPEVPKDLAEVTLRLLARQREQRYATAEEAVDALNACAGSPRNGRAELIAVLRERFPGHVPARTNRAFAAAEGTPAPEPLPPDALTLRASQPASTPREEVAASMPGRRRRRLIAAFLGVGLAAAALTVGVVRMLAPSAANPTTQLMPTPALAAPGNAATRDARTGAPRSPATAPETQASAPAPTTDRKARARVQNAASTSKPPIAAPGPSKGPTSVQRPTRRQGQILETPLSEAENALDN